MIIDGFDINTLCQIANNGSQNEDPADRIVDVYFWVMEVQNNDTSHIVKNNYTELIAPYQRASFNVTNSNDRDIAAMRGWMWLCCGMALGWLQTTDNADSIFNRLIPLEYFIGYCTDMFGPTIDTTYITTKTAQSAYYFKDPWNYTATNVLLPNGGYDPWHALGSYVNRSDIHQVSLLTPGLLDTKN